MGDPAPGKLEADRKGWFIRDYFPEGVCPMSKMLLDAAGSGTGIDFNSSTLTTGILIDGTCTTGISISASSLTDGIKISGATPVDGIEISSACSGSAINVTGTNTGRALRIGTKVSESTSLKISSGESVDAEPANNYLFGLFSKVNVTEATSTDELRGAWIRTRVNEDMHIGETANWGYGVCGAEVQLKFYGGSGGTDTHAWQNSALWAQLETAGATTNFKTGSVSSCVLANVGLTATTVIDSGAVVAGVTINSNTAGSGVTATGGFYGMYIYQDNASCLDFTTGIKLDDDVATTGIEIGNATTGMKFDGTFTTAIKFEGDAAYNPIHIGTKANTATGGLNMNGQDSYDNQGGIMMFCDDGGVALATTYTTSAIWTRYLITANQTSNTATGAYLQMKLKKAAGTLDLTTSDYSATKVYVETDSAVDLKSGGLFVLSTTFEMGNDFTNTAGNFAGINVEINDKTNTLTGNGYGILIRKNGSSTAGWPVGLMIDDVGATTGIKIGNATTGIQLDGTFTGNAIAVTQDALTVGDSYSGVRVAVTADAPNNAYGMAAYFDTTVTGTQANNIYNTGSWVNMGAGYTCAANKLTVAFEGGIYDSGATLTNAWFIGLQLQMVTTSAPTTRNWFRFNYNDGSSGSMTAIFAAANPGSAAFTSGAGITSTKNGDIAIADIVGTGVVYVRTYDGAG